MADAEGLLDIRPPHHIRLHGVDRVRDAAAVISILTRKMAERSGWTVDDCKPLRLVVRLRDRLRAVRYDILRALVNDAGNINAHRRLRTHGDAIRRIGRDESATSELRVLAVKLGNRLKKVAAKMISRKRSAAWFTARCGSIVAHVRQVYCKHYIPLVQW